jgi:hypothetical protein
MQDWKRFPVAEQPLQAGNNQLADKRIEKA